MPLNTVNEIKKATRRQIDQLSLEQIDSYTASKARAFPDRHQGRLMKKIEDLIGHENRQKMTPVNLPRLDQQDLQNLSPARIRALSAQQLLALTVQQIKWLQPDQLNALAPSQIDVLTLNELYAITASQLQSITPVQREALIERKKKLAPINGTVLNCRPNRNAVQALSPLTIASIPINQIHNILPERIAWLSAEQINALQCGQINAFQPAQVNAFDNAQLDAFSANQLRLIRASQRRALITCKTRHLGPLNAATLNAPPNRDAVQALSPLTIASIPINQIQNILPEKIAWLSAEQINALQHGQIRAFSTPQLDGFSAKQLQTILRTQCHELIKRKRNLSPLIDVNLNAQADLESVQALSPLDIASIPPNQLNAIEQRKMAWFSSEQLGALLPIQLNAFSKKNIRALGSSVLNLSPTAVSKTKKQHRAWLIQTEKRAERVITHRALSNPRLSYLVGPASIESLNSPQARVSMRIHVRNQMLKNYVFWLAHTLALAGSGLALTDTFLPDEEKTGKTIVFFLSYAATVGSIIFNWEQARVQIKSLYNLYKEEGVGGEVSRKEGKKGKRIFTVTGLQLAPIQATHALYGIFLIVYLATLPSLRFGVPDDGADQYTEAANIIIPLLQSLATSFYDNALAGRFNEAEKIIAQGNAVAAYRRMHQLV